MKKNYIGLSTTTHDPAIAVVNSAGEVVFAEATERYMQSKRGLNCVPDDYNYISEVYDKYCEKDVDLIVGYTWSKRMILISLVFSKVVMSLLRDKNFNAFENRIWSKRQTLAAGLFANNFISSWNLDLICLKNGIKMKRKHYEHHLTHAANACYTSSFNKALCAVVDGMGEVWTTSFFKYDNGRLEHCKSIKRSIGDSSLGFFYGQVTELCGWDMMKGEAWKIMGLAPYGKYNEHIKKLMDEDISVKKGEIKRNKDRRITKTLKKYMRNSDQSPLHYADLAFNGQLVFKEIMTKILEELYKIGSSENLILSGGCALNSACNGKILKETPFKKLFVPSAPADDGNAIGAALLSYYEDNPAKKRMNHFQSPYLGASLSENTKHRLEKLGRMKSKLSNGEKIHEKAARLLSEGKIIGWVQGRVEFGPRALGNRSILADPRIANVKDRLNGEIKFREEFRPFTPSILHEYGPEYFENYTESPYMERALIFRKEVRDKVPGVVHIDKTGRLQTVKREWNEKYYDLIVSFKRLTGIPLVLNTSFNVMGKPIIHSLEDVVAVFYTSGLDAMVVGESFYEKCS